MDYFYSAAERRSRGVLWPIFTPALITAQHLQMESPETSELPPCAEGRNKNIYLQHLRI